MKRLIGPAKAVKRLAERAALEVVPDKAEAIEPAINGDPGFVELVPEPGKGGRIVPYRRSKAVEERILQGIMVGMPVDRAAIAAGISHTTVHRWRNQFPAFFKQCRRAEALAEEELMKEAKKAHGTGSRWLLACRFGYVPVQKQEVTGADGGPVKQLTIVQHIMGKLSAESDG